MSARSSIVKAISAGIKKELNGTGDFLTNLYENVDNKVTHFDNIGSFPYVSVTPGPETREDLPSNFSWANLTVYLRIYVENSEDAQGELETIIEDLENYIDKNLQISYNVLTPQGTQARKTVDSTIVSITTDEGLLNPNALGEIVLDVRYEKHRKV